MGEVWFALDDPSLPMPWKGIVDGNTGCLYYWNPETNITQYEKPAYWVSSPSLAPACSPGPFYPPHPTASDYNLHSQCPNLYPHYQAPAETVINGYTFPTQFPFPNHTHTPTNQPINPQSQSTDYHYHSLTHPPIAHPSYHLPPFATSAYPSESDGYLSSLPYPSDKPFSSDPYSTSPHNSSYSPITYPHTEPNESIVHPYQLPYAADLIPPSALAYTAGGTSCIEKVEVPPPVMKKSPRHNLKMRSHVMMKRKPRSQFPRRRRTQNNGGSEGDLCKVPLLMAVNWYSTVLSNKSLDSVSELTILDLVVKNGFISTSSKDAPMFFPGDDVDAVYNQLLGSDELYQTERAKDILLLGGFRQILDKKGGPMVDWGLRSIHAEVARLYLNLSLEKPITNLGNSSLVNHFCHLVIDVDNLSLVTNLISGLQPALLSMSFVELPVILVVSLPESYQHGVKHEVVEFDQFMVCSFVVRELKKTLRVAHLAHLRATLYNWKVGVKNVLSCSKGGFEYDMHLENLIESLTRHYRNLFVNIHGMGIEHKCSVKYHWLPSLNWNQNLLLGQGINFQHGFSFIGKDIVCLHYNLCFAAEMRFLGLITSFVQIGLETIMQIFSHTWDLQIHQLQMCWITTVNAFTATLSHGLNKANLVVVFGISSGTIDLPSLVISNDQFEVMVTSCHFLGGEYSDNIWLYFVTSTDQGVKWILITMENPVQHLSFLFDLNSKNRVVAFVIEICNQERHTGKDQNEALDDIRVSTVVMCASLLVENVTALVTLKHNNEALDDIGVVAFVYISFVVLQHSHFPRKVKLLGVVEFPRDSMTGNALATFWLCGVTAMSSLKEDWVPHIPSLIEMLIKALIGDTKLNFATESYMTPTGAIATGFVFNFGAASSINTSDIHMVYSLMCLPYLKELFLEMFAVGLLLYCCSMDVDIIWCSPQLDFTFGQPIQQYQFSVQLDFQVTTIMDMYLESRGRTIGLLIFTRCMNQQISHHTFLLMAMKLLYHYILGYSSVNYVILLVGHHFGVNVECGTLKGCLSDVWRQLHLDVTSLLRLGYICNEMAHKEVSWVMLAIDWRTIKTHVLDTAVSSFMITPIVGETLALLCIFKITEHMITRHIQGLKLIETLVLSMLAFIVISRLHVGNILAILLECPTFYIDAFYSLEVVMMEVSQLASQSTTQTLCDLALLFNADHTKLTAADGMVNEVTGKVIVDALIPFIMLINGSCGDCNAQKPKTNSFHAKMWGDDIQSTKNLLNEDPSDIVVHTKATAAIGGHLVQFPTCSIIRHEDMPSLKGGGMIGSWLTELHYLNGLIIILG